MRGGDEKTGGNRGQALSVTSPEALPVSTFCPVGQGDGWELRHMTMCAGMCRVVQRLQLQGKKHLHCRLLCSRLRWKHKMPLNFIKKNSPPGLHMFPED